MSVTRPRRHPSRHPLARLASLVALAATLACGPTGTQPTEPIRASGGPAGDSHAILVHNAGGTTLTAISILTGEDVPPVQVPRLSPGARTGIHRIGVLHEHPIVSVTVAGERRTYHPVEGFSGFNQRLAPGRYVIQLRWNAAAEFLETVVVAR